MPRRKDISSILIIGAGPIIIGQACEFDYSGAQACKALKEEGFRVILVNSNPATIMTDPLMADATNNEPIHWKSVEKIIEKEKPDAILPTMGGQNALNTALSLAREGVIEKHGVILIGANKEAIDKAEDRELFDKTMKGIGIETPNSGIAHSMEDALNVQAKIGFPCIIRPSFTMGGTGGGIAYNIEEFEKICDLAVRGLDELLDYQSYPVLAAELSTMKRRPLGIGIINFAFWLAKNDTNYQDPNLELVDEWAEAWSYYLIKASADLAVEKGTCPGTPETKYGQGITPNQTYKKDVDELVKHKERQDWKGLRKQLKETGIRNSTLMALMPAETSAQISNSTNGIEPPRAFVSIKQSKHGVLKQVVPGYPRLKNKYDLLWDQKSPQGYLKIMAVLQKYIDQGISVNTSYNPEHFDEEKVPMSQLIQDILTFYKYGGKQLYYNNTFDGQGEIDINKDTPETVEVNMVSSVDDEDCESCKI